MGTVLTPPVFVSPPSALCCDCVPQRPPFFRKPSSLTLYLLLDHGLVSQVLGCLVLLVVVYVCLSVARRSEFQRYALGRDAASFGRTRARL
jgi:hypothetical protein